MIWCVGMWGDTGDLIAEAEEEEGDGEDELHDHDDDCALPSDAVRLVQEQGDLGCSCIQFNYKHFLSIFEFGFGDTGTKPHAKFLITKSRGISFLSLRQYDAYRTSTGAI